MFHTCHIFLDHSGIFWDFFLGQMTFFWDKYCKTLGHFQGHFASTKGIRKYLYYSCFLMEYTLLYLCYSNYWALVIKLKSCLEIAMPFVVANYCLNTSPHHFAGVRYRYDIHAYQLINCIIGLYRYLASPEA